MTLAHVRINSGEGWPENRTLGIGTNWEIPKKGIKNHSCFILCCYIAVFK